MNAVITGASKGIGKAIAKIFVENNVNVAICARDIETLKATQKELQEYNPNAKVLIKSTDMSDKNAVLDFAEYVKDNFNQIDILVNNAGIFIPGSCHEEEEDRLEMMMMTNVYSAYHLTRALLPKMIDHKSGHIFNMCSVASIKAYANGGSYSISKFALYGFSQNLREELKPKNIKVTSILPGATWSTSWAGVDLPEERLMQASDIAQMVWSAAQLSPAAVVEDIIIRPQLGDL